MSAPPQPTFTSPEHQLSYLSTTSIPTSLIDLRNKHTYITAVIHYCETSYLTETTSSSSNSKSETETQTKEYLADALSAVVKDVECVTCNLTKFLELQVQALEGLGPRIEGVKNRIHMVKSNHAQSRLRRINRVDGSGSGKVGGSVERVKCKEVNSENVKVIKSYERVPLAARLRALDDVGHAVVR